MLEANALMSVGQTFGLSNCASSKGSDTILGQTFGLKDRASSKGSGVSGTYAWSESSHRAGKALTMCIKISRADYM